MKTRFLLSISVSASLVFLAMPLSLASATNAGQKCSKSGAISGTKQNPLVCTKVGGRLVWKSAKKGAISAAPKETVSQANAKRAAKSYLGFMAFSRSKLIEQLEFENYSTADATYGVDAQNADWNAQAAKSAKSYLKLMPFSRTGLIDQLIFEGFSQSQAEFGVSTTGL